MTVTRATDGERRASRNIHTYTYTTNMNHYFLLVNDRPTEVTGNDGPV